MRKTYLEKVITTSLILTTTVFGYAWAAPITSGTHNIGGTIPVSGNYVDTSTSVTLNATGNVIFSSSGNSQVINLRGVGATVDVNMNNKNLTFTNRGMFLQMESNQNGVVKVNNAYDISMTDNRVDGNLFHNDAGSGLYVIQAKHDITMDGTSTYPHVWIGGTRTNDKSTGKIIAGNDFTSSSYSNVFNIQGGADFSLTAGRNFSVTAKNLTYPAIYVTSANTKSNFVSKTGDFTINGSAMYASKGASIAIEAGNNFNVLGTANYTIEADGADSQIGIIAHNGNIVVDGNKGPLVAWEGAKINLQADKDIQVTSPADGSYVVYVGYDNAKFNADAQNGSFIINATGNAVYGLYATTNGTASIHAAKDIIIGANTQRAVYGKVNSIVDLTADAGKIYLTANKDNENNNAGILSNNNSAVNLHSDTEIAALLRGVQADGGTVNFAKGLVVTAPTAIETVNNGKVTATNAASTKKITGNITADGAGSSADVNFMTADSYLTGATTISNAGAVNLEFANDGTWNVTGDSSLTNLVNNGTVDLRYTGKNVNETLTTANLSGNGNYVVNTDLQASYDSKDVQKNGDKIIITTSSTGNNIIELRDVSLDKKLASQGYLLLVEDQSNGGTTFSGKDLAHGGIFKYVPVITTANPSDYTGYNAAAKNWYLTGFVKTIIVSDNTKGNLGLSGTRYANYFMDQDTLLKRLGELRTLKGEPETNGIWARYRHGGMEGAGFSGDSTMVQVGYDKKTSNKRYTGLAFNHTINSYDFDGGATGDGSQDALTIYNTWLGDKNHYFDIVGKIGKMRGYSNYIDKYYPEKNHYDNWYYSISGEYGRKNIDKNGWYYEPQAQLTLGRINGYDVTTTTGTKVNMGGITSLISRAGVTFGKEFDMKNSNKHSNIYGKINWLHEFKGDVRTSLLDTYGDSYDHEKSYGGSWWNAGIGATINVNKNMHMYLDFEKNFGGEVTTNWIGQLGCQWTWK